MSGDMSEDCINPRFLRPHLLLNAILCHKYYIMFIIRRNLLETNEILKYTNCLETDLP